MEVAVFAGIWHLSEQQLPNLPGRETSTPALLPAGRGEPLPLNRSEVAGCRFCRTLAVAGGGDSVADSAGALPPLS